MQTLRELLRLSDPLHLSEAEVPVELKALIAAFPNKHEKAIEKLWGGPRLVWHGKRFFDANGLGDAYDMAEKAAHAAIKQGDPIHVDVQVDAVGMPGLDEDAPGTADFDYEVELDPDRDMQEVYLGYDPKRDKLYIGFDAWGEDEETRDEKFDDAFEEATGVKFDIDNEAHHKVYSECIKKMQDEKLGFYGLIFEITDHGGEFEAEEALAPMSNGFYRGTYAIFKRQHPTVIDLRLD